MRRNVALAFAIGALLTTPAIAADLVYDPVPAPAPPPPIVDYGGWSGWYIGGHVGYGWVDGTATQLQAVPAFPAGTTSSDTADDFFGGFQVGYDHFWDGWLIGVEFDWSWTDASASVDNASPNIAGFTTTATQDIDAFYSLTAKVGRNWTPNTVVYAEAGIAWLDVDYTLTTPGSAVTLGETRDGFTVGGGFETLLADAWTMELEYSYADFGEDQFTFSNSGSPFDIENDLHLIRLGINYRFN